MRPSRPSRSIVRRLASTFVGVGAVFGGLVALQAGLAPNAEFATSVDRVSEQTANRSSSRSDQLDTSSDSLVIAAVSPPTTVSPTATSTLAPVTTTTSAAPANAQTGQASYYDYKAGGCAHKTIPKGTTVTVTNTATGKSTTCVVNDRGPFVAGRIIDLDVTVFKQLASTGAGVFNAKITW